jgi:hypothetical protein
MHKIMNKKFYLSPKFGTLFNNKWITISELLHHTWGWCGPPGGPLAPPFRLFILMMGKTLATSPHSPEKFRSRCHLEDKFRGTEVSVPVPFRDGEVPLERSPSTPPPSPSPLLTPMMRSE